MRTDFALVLTAALLLDSFPRNSGEHASRGPCRPGFSQSFYSVLISRDVLQGQGIRKGKSFHRLKPVRRAPSLCRGR
ncbi:hypothetical protein VZT92_025586 [Zoarces viviparus]|uniref:Secreted protein n=1 Tax=Zoarces viviparus TaxID=48416 RepID=A0AAW1DXP4_ZOAVI